MNKRKRRPVYGKGRYSSGGGLAERKKPILGKLRFHRIRFRNIPVGKPIVGKLRFHRSKGFTSGGGLAVRKKPILGKNGVFS